MSAMRELKFRAWDKRRGMSEPFDLIDATNVEIAEQYKDTVEELTFLQYTGLRDKNGVEIYEGDIVTFPGHPSPYVSAVTFQDGSFATRLDSDDFRGWIEISQNSYATEDDFEVIGNIYENPELVK